MFARIMKANPYHDELGRFSTKDKAKFVSTTGVFASRLGKLRGAGGGARKTYTREELDADIAKLEEANIRAGSGVSDHFLENYPGVKPSDVTRAMASGGVSSSGSVRVLSSGKLNVALTVETATNGPKYQISRDFDPVKKSVYHDFLVLPANAQGAGTVKQVFRESLPLYDKMGMKSIDVFANIDGGGYAWGRYGFDQNGTEFKRAAAKGLNELTNKLGNRKLSTEAWAEHAAVSEILSGPLGKEPRLPRVFTSLKTPNLDAELAGIPGAKAGSFLKTILHKQSWHGALDLTDKEQRAHLNDYIKKR